MKLIEIEKKRRELSGESVTAYDIEGFSLPEYMINSPESIKTKGTNGGMP